MVKKNEQMTILYFFNKLGTLLDHFGIMVKSSFFGFNYLKRKMLYKYFFRIVCNSSLFFGSQNAALGISEWNGMIGFDLNTFWDHRKQYGMHKRINFQG